MSTAFPDSLRSLQSDTSHSTLLVILSGVLLLLAWGSWFLFARVAVSEVSQQARLEVAGAITVSAPVDGQIKEIHVVAGQPVRLGDELFELDTDTGRQHIRAQITGSLIEITSLPAGTTVESGEVLGVIVPPGPLHVIADFPPSALGRIRPSALAWLRLDGYPWTRYGTLAATVTQVTQNTRNGHLLVQLALAKTAATAIPLQHGLRGTVEVEVEKVAPVTLLLRAAGQGSGAH